jgi:hypothetical protein
MWSGIGGGRLLSSVSGFVEGGAGGLGAIPCWLSRGDCALGAWLVQALPCDAWMGSLRGPCPAGEQQKWRIRRWVPDAFPILLNPSEK